LPRRSREKMKELGLVAQTGKRGNRSLCALERKEKPRAEAGRDLKWLCEPSDIT